MSPMIKSETTEETKVEAHEGQRYLLTVLAQDDAAKEKLEGFLKENEITPERVENLGRRNLTFSINKHSELTLISAFFTVSPSTIPALEKKLRHEEYIERFLLTTWKAEVAQFSERGGRRPRKDV